MKISSSSLVVLVLIIAMVLSGCSSNVNDQARSDVTDAKPTHVVEQETSEPTNNDSTNTDVKDPEDGNTYLGFKAPGKSPELFATGIVSTDNFEHSSPTISEDGKEIYWSRIELPLAPDKKHVIVYSKLENNQWSKPQVAPFSGVNSDDGPRFNHDFTRIYFHSKHDLTEDNTGQHDIYYTEKIDGQWSAPQKLGSEINTDEGESSLSFTSDGSMAFCRYYKETTQNEFFLSKLIDGEFDTPEKMRDDLVASQININPFINSSGDILLFGSVYRRGGFGASDLYVSFKSDDNVWSEPVNLGETINTEANERFPSLSPDGKYLFFISNRENGLGDVFWVAASIIYELKPN